jgi:hypothetical protein
LKHSAVALTKSYKRWCLPTSSLLSTRVNFHRCSLSFIHFFFTLFLFHCQGANRWSRTWNPPRRLAQLVQSIGSQQESLNIQKQVHWRVCCNMSPSQLWHSKGYSVAFGEKNWKRIQSLSLDNSCASFSNLLVTTCLRPLICARSFCSKVLCLVCFQGLSWYQLWAWHSYWWEHHR